MSRSSSFYEVIKEAQKQKRRSDRNLTGVSFADYEEIAEYNPNHCTMAVHSPGLEGRDWEETPWYAIELEEEEVTDSEDEKDDELTALCKKIVSAGDYDKKRQQQQPERAAKVQSHVINFALKLKHKRLAQLPKNEPSLNDSFVAEDVWSSDEESFEEEEIIE